MVKYNNNLSTYLGDISDHELLGPEGEISLAKQIEDAEVEVWRRIFSFGPAGPLVLETLKGEGIDLSSFTSEKELDENNEDSLERLASEMAAYVRERDRDRIHLDAAIQAIDAKLPKARGRTKWRRSIDSAIRKAAALRQRFVKANLRLVITMGRKFAGYGIPLEDLIQEGNIGLIKGVDRYEYRQGYRFSTYAGWWIRHAMGRAVANTSRTVRVPVHVQDENQRIVRAQREISAKLGRTATNREIAERCETTVERVAAIRGRALAPIVSLSEPLGEDGSTRLDLLAAPANDEHSPFEGLLQLQESAQVQELLDTLTAMQADVLRKRFGLAGFTPTTLRKIGDEYGLSRERIRQIQSSALQSLRTTLEAREGRQGRVASGG